MPVTAQRTPQWWPRGLDELLTSIPLRVQDARQAHTWRLLAGGADLVGVMERLGHAQIQTTQRYLHSLPDSDQKNLDAFSRIADRRP